MGLSFNIQNTDYYVWRTVTTRLNSHDKYEKDTKELATINLFIITT